MAESEVYSRPSQRKPVLVTWTSTVRPAWARLVDARYDVTNPATEVASPGSQAFVKLVQYTIDGLGNRSQVQTTPPTPPSSVTYAVDVVNQYTALGGVSRVHDSNGNLSDDGTQLYLYDFKNRLVEVKQKSSGASIATYRYDALGRRVEKAVNGGATTRYVLDGQQVIEEYDASDAWQAAYIYEDGIDRPRAMDRADIADVNGNSNTTEVLRFSLAELAVALIGRSATTFLATLASFGLAARREGPRPRERPGPPACNDVRPDVESPCARARGS